MSKEILQLGYAGHIVDFFVDRRALQGYEGYVEVAAELQKRLERVARAADQGTVRTDSLPITTSHRNPFRLYGGKPEATSILMLLTENLTNATLLVQNREKNTGYGHVVSRGQYNEQHIYFIETYARAEHGNYMTWAVTNELPEDLLPAPNHTQARPFITTGEEETMKMDFYRNFGKIKTVPIDEAEVVRSWINRQAA